MEVYNDFDHDLVNLFRCVKYHADELEKELKWCMNSREIFVYARDQRTMPGLTDIQRAARFFLQVKYSYGADQRSYGCAKRQSIRSIDVLHAAAERLDAVIIECRDFEPLIKTYDRPSALFFLDPPYWGTEGYYSGFQRTDHERLKTVLQGIKGRFIMTYNDCQEVREMYSEYKIEEISRLHNLQTRYYADPQYKELFITNY